ncbi:MAG: hypothetical protein ACYDEX_14340 [Mobilitalea sp.]
MSRKNIFDILDEKRDINSEINKIEDLLSESSIDNCTLEDIVDDYCIKDWKARGRYINCDEIRSKLSITKKDVNRGLDEEYILFYLEYLSNIIWLCEEIYFDDQTECDKEYDYFKECLLGLIEDLGFEAKIFEEKEWVLLVERNAAVNAAAEIADPDIVYDIIEYNHHLLKGNTSEKQKILKILADKFEPTRKELGKINPALESNIGYLLNKMNIRHNNKEGKAASGYVASIPKEELEDWYDETYQMLLLAMLELDNVNRNKKVAELKKIIEG